MIQTPPMPRTAESLTPEREGQATPEPAPQERRRDPGRPRLAPQWLQVVVIAGLLGSAVFVWLDGRTLWAGALAVAGLAFLGSFILRRMVGDEYGRT